MCTVAVVACGLAGCASHDGTDLARQACQHVERSLALYQASLHAPSPAVATAKQAQAVAQLRDALPIAATAAGEAGQYQALMATLDESDHLPGVAAGPRPGRAVLGGRLQRRGSLRRRRPRPRRRPRTRRPPASERQRPRTRRRGPKAPARQPSETAVDAAAGALRPRG